MLTYFDTLPRTVEFEWFSSLYQEDYLSKVAAYLTYRALNETKALIKVGNAELLVEAPEVSIITKRSHSYEKVLEIASRLPSYPRKFTSPEEFEFGYRPDTLGFYLPKPTEGLDPSIYILIDRITWYSATLERIGFRIDPNTIIGTVFIHEYSHLLLHLLGLDNAKNLDISRVFSVVELEEAICEGISYSLLPESLSNHFGGGVMTPLLLNIDSVPIRATIELGKASIEIESVV